MGWTDTGPVHLRDLVILAVCPVLGEGKTLPFHEGVHKDEDVVGSMDPAVRFKSYVDSLSAGAFSSRRSVIIALYGIVDTRVFTDGCPVIGHVRVARVVQRTWREQVGFIDDVVAILNAPAFALNRRPGLRYAGLCHFLNDGSSRAGEMRAVFQQSITEF